MSDSDDNCMPIKQSREKEVVRPKLKRNKNKDCKLEVFKKSIAAQRKKGKAIKKEPCKRRLSTATSSTSKTARDTDSMSDSDDDYMSEKVLQECKKKDTHTGLIRDKNNQNKLDVFRKSLAAQQRKKKELEKELRERGLQTEISSQNKGYKILKKMGYLAGTSLGRSRSGLIQLIPLEVKTDNSGVGHKSFVEEKKRKNSEMDTKREKKFRAMKIEQGEIIKMKKELYKAQKACEDLDYHNNVKRPLEKFFWTKAMFDQTVGKVTEDDDEDDEDDDDDVNESNDDDNEDEKLEVDSKEELDMKLTKLLQYLRQKYYYCVYCVAKAADEEELRSFCPGMTRSDHDDEDL